MNNLSSNGRPSQKIELPVEAKQLGAFINSLLGQPQTLERRRNCSFTVTHSFLMHLCAMILQRVSQQNLAEPLAFEAKIGYEGEMTRTVSTLEAFEHFHETKKMVSEYVRLTISFLIIFPSKVVPERQEILVIFRTVDLDLSLPLPETLWSIKTGVVAYQIRHTERTWADDIDGILKQEIDKLVHKESWFQATGKILCFILVPLVMLVGGVLPDVINDLSHAKSMTTLALQAESLAKLPVTTVAGLDTKINFLMTSIRPVVFSKEVGAISRVGSLIVGLFVGFCLFVLAIRPNPAFVVLTDEAESFRLRILKKNRNRILIVMWSAAVAIGLGVASNYLYAYLTK